MALVDACSQIDSGHLKKVKAVAVAGQQHGLVILGDDQKPLRPAKLWNDTESAPQALRAEALESLLVEKGLLDPATVDVVVQGSPAPNNPAPSPPPYPTPDGQPDMVEIVGACSLGTAPAAGGVCMIRFAMRPAKSFSNQPTDWIASVVRRSSGKVGFERASRPATAESNTSTTAMRAVAASIQRSVGV